MSTSIAAIMSACDSRADWRAGLAAEVDVLMALAVIPRLLSGPQQLATVRCDPPGGRCARPGPGPGRRGAARPG